MKELLKVLEFTADRTQALADSQSVAGEPLHVGDVTLIPVSSISCGFAGGEKNKIIFSGGVYVGENTAQSASVRIVCQRRMIRARSGL